MSDKLYIIGGSGFIGKNMVRCLYRHYDIYVFDKYIDNAYFNQYPDVKLCPVELDKESIPSTFETPGYIINLASIVTAERDLTLFEPMIQANLKVLLNRFERFNGEEKLRLFVQFGSCEEYGDAPSPYTEAIQEQPNSPYALVKLLTTRTAIMLHKNYGFPTAVVRPSNLFGPFQPKNKFIPYVISQLQKNNPLNVTPCEQRRDFIYVDDFVWAIEQLLLHSDAAIGKIINIGSGESISLKEIIEMCRDELNSDSIINYGALPYRENESMELSCNMGNFESIINSTIHCNVKDDIKKLSHLILKQ